MLIATGPLSKQAQQPVVRRSACACHTGTLCHSITRWEYTAFNTGQQISNTSLPGIISQHVAAVGILS